MASRSAKNRRFGLHCFYAAQEGSACDAGIRTVKTHFKLEADLIFVFFYGAKRHPGLWLYPLDRRNAVWPL
jgi:hypothetical protein